MKKLMVLFLLVTTVFLTGCMSHIDDENGDDTSLATFTIQDKLDSGSFSSTGSSSMSVCSGGTTYAFNYDDIDCDNISLSYGKFSGVAKILATDVEDGDTFSLTINIELESGNLEVVLVDPDNQIIDSFDVGANNVITVNDAKDGIYFVIIGGETAKFEIEMNRVVD